jgi:CDP-6-deoxy-D-xylo-4-hexulose-3-dehydrase
VFEEVSRATELRAQILDLVKEFHAEEFAPRKFVPGKSPVPVSGRVFDERDVISLTDSALDFWLTTGRFALEFETRFAEAMDQRHCVLVNSGSSANLLALATLTSPKFKERALKPGDEVITAAVGFPTTVNPSLQYGLVPVFVDVDPVTHNVIPEQIEAAVSPKTKAIMIAHTLGNPFDLDTVMAVAKKHDLWVIEDCCDAVGSTYNGQKVGTFGDLATVSFYPAHHITMGEGGAVLMQKGTTRKITESFRDWGRDCWCAPGESDTCGRRFDWQLGELPYGYDHKYIYSHIGYNLKATDMQAAVGVSQLDKLDGFIEARKHNYKYLYDGLKDIEHLQIATATPKSDPSWFGFPFSIKREAPFTRNEFVARLDERKIGTRLVFAGNMVRQPAYLDKPHRIATELVHADYVAEQAMWIGVYPGLTTEMLDYVIETIREFVQEKEKTADAS